MKKFFSRHELKKSKSVQCNEKTEEDSILNGKNNLISTGTFQVITTARCPPSNECPSSSSIDAATISVIGTRSRHHFDHELDKHMMQIISDIKYIKKRPKFVAIGEVNFQRECLDAHNEVRERYGCRPLVWSQGLSDLAHSWAKKLADRGRILFPEIPEIGENIRLAIASDENHLPTGSEITNIWAQEVQYFDFNRPRWSLKSQHFTQIVWKETEQMGIARHWNAEKNYVAVVAFYRPSGNSNAPGEFEINVPAQSQQQLSIPISSNTPLRCVASLLLRTTATSDEATTTRSVRPTGKS